MPKFLSIQFNALKLLAFSVLFLHSSTTFPIESISEENNLTDIKEETALAFVDLLNTRNTAGIVDIFNMKEFGYRTASHLWDNKNEQKDFVTEFAAPGKSTQFIKDAFGLLETRNTTTKYKGIIDTPNGRLPLVRMDFETGGHEFALLVINPQGQIIDFFFATKGKLTSSAVAQATQLLLKDSDQFLKRLLGQKEIDKTFLEQFERVVDFQRAGEMAKAFEVFKTLPEDIQSNRTMIELGIILTQSISEKDYLTQLQKLDTFFSDDKSTAFMLIDYHVLTNNLDKALASVENTMNYFGQDAALLNIKAIILLQAGNAIHAEMAVREAIDLEPELIAPYWMLASIHNAAEKYKELTQTFALIEETFDLSISPQNLRDTPEYDNYTQSAEFKHWADR